MTMIQSYKNEELENLVFDLANQEEWKTLASDLGLGTQLAFLQSAKSPNQYPFMNQSLQNIFGAICPRKVELKAYSKTPIPLEVLKEISLCVNEGYFEKIQVWYDDKTPDPVAVGVETKHKVYYTLNGKDDNSEYEFKSDAQAKDYATTLGATVKIVYSESNHYLIARWADELRPMEELKAIAKERLVEKYAAQYTEALTENKRKLESIENLIGQYLMGEKSEWDLRPS